jgi:Flp pilus assembly protein TadG
VTGRNESGTAALELLILAPVILFLVGLVIAAGRVSVAQGSVAAAARDAARQASLAVGPAAARQAALSTARAALRSDGLQCRPSVSVDLSGFAAPPGQPAQVSATVTCTVRLADLLVPGLPGSRTLTSTFVSPLDPYRSRADAVVTPAVTAQGDDRAGASA